MKATVLGGEPTDVQFELLAPVEDPSLKRELEDTLERTLADDTFGWELQPDGNWKRRQGRTRCVHRELMERAAVSAMGRELE